MRNDPYPAYCFRVKLNYSKGHEHASMYFKRVQGLSYETEVTDYQEGGCNGFTHRLVGPTKWPNLVLERGFSCSRALIEWRQRWMDGGRDRANGEIAQLNTALEDVAVWQFFDAWPCKWELSAFDASKSELSMETLELAHHGLVLKPMKTRPTDPQVFPHRPE